MKKRFLLSTLLFFVFIQIKAQITISGDITSNTTWTNNNIYLLSGGFVYVTNNATLTIEPGTIIKGNASSLVITRGAKIIAEGTATQPIVFTSYQASGSRSVGDWGGVLILGKAPINDPAGERVAEGGIDGTKGLYGGTDPYDSSGVMRYCRIEYAGVAYQANSETNGLTLGGVGSKTVIDYIQVSFGGDDAFEFFGGTVNAKHLIAFRGTDDEFDTDYGYSGMLQFCVSLRDSNIADVSGSNGFESDNDATGTTNTPLTNTIISNFTLIGPKVTSSTSINSNYKRGAHLRRNTTTSVYNSVITGYPVGLKIENQLTADNVTNGLLEWKNNILAGCPQDLDSSSISFSMRSWYNANSNTSLTNSTDIMLADPYTYTNPDFQPQSGSPLLTGADFSSSNLNDDFFDEVTYRGAFDGTNDWTACWANWDPQNADYTTAGLNYLTVSASAQSSTTICQGDSVVLTASASSSSSYVWSNGETTQSITVKTAGTYSVTATNSMGCSVTSDEITVSVNALPTALLTASGNTTFCEGDSLQLTASTADSYLWSTGETTKSIYASIAGNYFVTVTNTSTGCSNTSSVTTITINTLPIAIVTANGSTSFCTGDSLEICANSATSYLWSTGETTQCIYVAATGSYSASIVDTNGCYSNPSTAVTTNVSSAPIPTISISNSTAICEGDSVILCSSQADTYLWTNGETTQCITVNAAGSYNVYVTNSDICNGTGSSDTITVTVNALPTADFGLPTGNSGTMSFINTSTGANSYLWDFGDGSTSVLENPTHTYAVDGTYTICLTAISGSGCEDSTCMTLDISSAIQEVENISSVILYPNPLNANATIEFTLNANSMVSINMFDLTGKISFYKQEKLNKGHHFISIDASEIPSGIYFTQIVDGKNSYRIKTVIVK